MGSTHPWIIVDDAIVSRASSSPDPSWLAAVQDQIGYWNSYARDPVNGYEIMTRRLLYVAPEMLVRLAYKYLKKETPILELGVGTGLVGRRLVKRGFTVDGVDFSRAMLEIAQARGYRQLLCADLRQTDLRELFSTPYHACMSVGVYGDFVDAAWLKYVCPLLAPNALIAIAGRAENLSELRALLEAEGFVIKEELRAFGHFTIDFMAKDYLYIVAVRSEPQNPSL